MDVFETDKAVFITTITNCARGILRGDEIFKVIESMGSLSNGDDKKIRRLSDFFVAMAKSYTNSNWVHKNVLFINKNVSADIWLSILDNLSFQDRIIIESFSVEIFSDNNEARWAV